MSETLAITIALQKPEESVILSEATRELINTNITALMTQADSLVVNDEDGVAMYKAISNDLSDVSSALENKRVELKAPHFEKGKQVDAFFKAPLAVIANVKARLGAKYIAYKKRMEDEANRLKREAWLEEEKRLKDLAEKEATGTLTEADEQEAIRVIDEKQQAAAAVTVTKKTDFGTVTTRKRWVAERDESVPFSEIADEWKALDWPKINKAVTGDSGIHKIHGFTITQEEKAY